MLELRSVGDISRGFVARGPKDVISRKSAGIGIFACVFGAQCLVASAWAGSFDDFNAGLVAFIRREDDNAIRLFSAALAAGDLPAHLAPVAYYDRGFSYARKNQFDNAIADFSKAAELDTNFIDAHVSLGRIHYMSGNHAQAIASFTAAIGLSPYSPAGYAGRAAAYRDDGMLDEAIADFDQVVKLEPENSWNTRSKGVFEWSVERYANAAASFAKAVQLAPRDAYTALWFQMGAFKAETFSGQAADALRAVRETKWPRPIIDFLLDRKNFDAVMALAETGSEADKKGQICEVNFYIGEWYLHRGERATAKSMIEKAAADCPTDFVERDPAQTELKRLQ